MATFVAHTSIVRTIWGRSDTVLFIFAGAAAEFALNKSVDWLYFTGRLPADPINRLFSTVSYASRIIFSEDVASVQAIDQITSIHRAVEQSRKQTIPDWAYRDVLFLLIDYSRAAYELLERKLSDEEMEELFDVFLRVGQRMGLRDLPENYAAWKSVRQQHLRDDLARSPYTQDLFKQYRKHLGWFRFQVLTEVQKRIVPDHVRKLLGFSKATWIGPVLILYRLSRLLRLDWYFISAVLPKQYVQQVRALGRK